MKYMMVKRGQFFQDDDNHQMRDLFLWAIQIVSYCAVNFRADNSNLLASTDNEVKALNIMNKMIIFINHLGNDLLHKQANEDYGWSAKLTTHWL